MQTTRRFRTAAFNAALPITALTMLTVLTPAAVQAQTGAQLRVLSPRAGDSLGTSTFKLDVSFQTRSNAPATGAELWMDGIRWAQRDFDTPQIKNVLSFDVDGSSLSAGTHNVVVKLFCVGGAVSTTKLSIVAGTNTGISDANAQGPVISFVAPLNGKRVSGTVELELNASPRDGVNPYVTIYVDKQFKTLKNYPPYVYSWDTTTVANGLHTIEASGYIEGVNITTNRRIKVLVDNAGGNTVRMNGIPDLSKTAPILSTLPAHTGPTLTIPLPKRSSAVRNRSRLPIGVAHFSSVAPDNSRIAPNAVEMRALPTAVTNAVDLQPIAPALPQPKATVTRATKSAVRMSGLNVSTFAARAAAPVFTAPDGSLPPLRTAVKRTVPAPRNTDSHIIINGKRQAIRTDYRANTSLSAFPNLQIAFDGQRIAFDVAPRVEAGMPLAPFRQIFEHTGGQVTWIPETRVVHAVNADREITIGVGKKTAKVNGESMVIERTPYIEHGRTIVPLSFVGKAMDVKINFDPATGRLQITSK